MKIGIDEFSQMLLFVPFNNDYNLVRTNIKQLLSEDEFFKYCFLPPEFDEQIAKATSSPEIEVSGFDWNFDNETRIKQLVECKKDAEKVYSWINTNEEHMFVIKGDAGTGKSTFLHFLKFKYRNSDISWHIIDIQKAQTEIRIQQENIRLPQNSLYLKGISAILMYITSSIFIENNGRLLAQETEQHINEIVRSFKDKFDGVNPRNEISDFFYTVLSPQRLSEDSYNVFCRKCASNICKWGTRIISQNEQDECRGFAIFLELLIYLSMCLDNNSRRIFAFDNFERYIGTDEIYDGQLTQFVDSLRKTQDSIFSNNQHLQGSYQVLLLMRNTSSRMITNLQVADLLSHNIDLSAWFDAGIILRKKIDWYNSHNIEIEDADVVLNIFNDTGLKGDTLRGLHYKISMLFNYNKRRIIDFLVTVLFSPLNKSYIETYKSYWKNENKVATHLNRFAARSIIFRLVLDALRDGNFFVNICAQTPRTDNGQGNDNTSSGYARMILSILHDYEMNRPKNDNSRYMPLRAVINRLFPSSTDSLDILLDTANAPRANLIAQVLYYMNYYNPRINQNIQLIDIQYNNCSSGTISIDSFEQLLVYIRNDLGRINLRITNAGQAYLYFVVYYFEFFACKSRYKRNQIKYFPNQDTPPLLCAIPTIEEIMAIENKDSADQLTCVKIVKVVSLEAKSCIRTMNNSQNNIDFYPVPNGAPISHQQRIINSHKGFIDNFIGFISGYYRENYDNDNDFKEKFDMLVVKLREMRDSYTSESDIQS